MGVEMLFYESEELKKRLKMNVDLNSDEDAKMMGLDNVDKGVLAPKAGMLSTDALTRFYEENFKKLKGEALYNTKVTKLILESDPKLGIADEPFSWQKKRITGVVTNRASFYADRIVLAGGVWCSTLLDPMGIYYDVKPRKWQYFVIRAESANLGKLLNAKGFNKEDCLPVVIAPLRRFKIRPEVDENSFWINYPSHIGIGFKLEEEPKPRESFFYYGKLPLITKYFPQFTGSKIFNMWAGLNTQMSAEEFYILEEEGLLAMNAKSGICMGDSMGRIAAAICLNEEYAELSKERLVKVSDSIRRVRKEKW